MEKITSSFIPTDLRPLLFNEIMEFYLYKLSSLAPRIVRAGERVMRDSATSYGDYLTFCINACREEFDKGYDDLGATAARIYDRYKSIERNRFDIFADGPEKERGKALYARFNEVLVRPDDRKFVEQYNELVAAINKWNSDHEFDGILEGEMALAAMSATAWLIFIYRTPNAKCFSLALRQEVQSRNKRAYLAYDPRYTNDAYQIMKTFALADASSAFTTLLADSPAPWELKPAPYPRPIASESEAAPRPSVPELDSEAQIAIAIKAAKGLIREYSRKHKWGQAFKAMVALGIIPADYPHKDFAERVETHVSVPSGTVLGSNQGWTFSSSDEKKYRCYYNDIKSAIKQAFIQRQPFTG